MFDDHLTGEIHFAYVFGNLRPILMFRGKHQKTLAATLGDRIKRLKGHQNQHVFFGQCREGVTVAVDDLKTGDPVRCGFITRLQ